jgi:hypothetical protein
MTTVEDSSNRERANHRREPHESRSDLAGRSVLGRFNSLIVDFVSLFFFFISLFGRWAIRNRAFRGIFSSTRERDLGSLCRQVV